MRFLAVVVLVFLSVGQAAAQRFTGNTVYMAVQCEVGHFAKDAPPGLDPRMKADVDFSWAIEQSTKVEAEGGISSFVKWLIGGVTVKQARTWTKIDASHIKGAFNIHEGNDGACQGEDVLQVPVGIHDCLMDSTDALIGGAEASCDKTRIVAGTLGADGKLSWKVVDVILNGEWDLKATYEIKVSAPAKATGGKKEAKSD